MNRAQSLRWACLLAALGLTVGAIVYPTEPDEQLSTAVVPAKRTVFSPATAILPSAEQAVWVATDVNPFEPRGWQPLPLVAETAKASVLPEPARVEAPPLPPPLPYKFMGEMNDGSDRVIYLGRGDQVLLARVGDILENSYKVIAIGAAQIDFESVPSGLKQSLTIPVRDN